MKPEKNPSVYNTESVFFLKNGYECNFIVFPETDKPVLIQVTEILNKDNINREITGLETAEAF